MYEKMGSRIFEDFQRRIESEAKSSFDIYAEETAADLVLQSPYVSDHLVEKGIIKRGEHTRLVPVFTANLSMQLYGTSESLGYKVTVKNAHKRAQAVASYSAAHHKRIMAGLKARRKSEYDLFYGLRSAALVESIQCDYIAGSPLSKQAETAASIALLRRFSRELPNFRDFLVVMDVDSRDDLALRQFASEAEFREYIQRFYSDSLYFQRRQGLIVQKAALADLTDNANELRRTRGKIFTEGAVAHAIEKLGLSAEKIVKELEGKKNAA